MKKYIAPLSIASLAIESLSISPLSIVPHLVTVICESLSTELKAKSYSDFSWYYKYPTSDSTQQEKLIKSLEEDTSSKTTTVDQETLQSQTQILTQSCQSDTQLAKEVFTVNFVQLLYDSEFEFGYTTPADDYVEKAIESYGTFAREWINDIFVKSFSEPSIIIAILRVISHFDYAQMYPQGMTMAAAAMVHRDVEVRECGIRCFENWEASENIDILKSVCFQQEWLNEYVQSVIKDLESLAI